MNYIFDWDIYKAGTNLIKHKISFELASTVFKDSRALSIYDGEHSEAEDRWITIGIAANSQLILVVHTFITLNSENVNIRIISARKATKKEIKMYLGEL